MHSYLRTLAGALLVLLFMILGFTWLIDPYDYWGTRKLDGLNRYKPEFGLHFQLVKPRQYERVRPATVVAGNSRVLVGFDPESTAWPAAARPVYNFGMQGVGLDGVVDAVLAAAEWHPPERIYLGVDFVDFLITEQQWRAHEPRRRPSDKRLADRLKELAQVSLSLDALLDSGKTILEQHVAHPEHTTPQGFNGLFHYVDVVATEGHATLFAQSNAENAKRFAARGKRVRWPGPSGSPQFEALDRIAAAARARGIDLVLFTYPYHAEVMRIAAEAGLRPAFEDWRLLLASWSARTGVPIWDFTRRNAVTSEPVPPDGDRRTQMRWYWEGGHFKPALGDRLIEVMVGKRAPGPLGAQLTGRTAQELALADKSGGWFQP